MTEVERENYKNKTKNNNKKPLQKNIHLYTFKYIFKKFDKP